MESLLDQPERDTTDVVPRLPMSFETREKDKVHSMVVCSRVLPYFTYLEKECAYNRPFTRLLLTLLLLQIEVGAALVELQLTSLISPQPLAPPARQLKVCASMGICIPVILRLCMRWFIL